MTVARTAPEPPPPVLPLETRVCVRCNIEKPLTVAFNQNGYGGRSRICAPCIQAGRRKFDSRVCAACGAEIPPKRHAKNYSTCDEVCTRLSVGLPPDFQIKDLDRATEQEIRNVLDAVILAASVGARRSGR